MITISKKQVKAMLKILNSETTKTRPALQDIRLINGSLYFTDGYIMAKINLETEPEAKDGKEIAIHNYDLERWYKLAKNKDVINELDFVSSELADASDTHYAYPDVEALTRTFYETYEGDKPIRISAELLKLAQDVIGSDMLEIKRCSENSYYVIGRNKDIECFVMGCK